MKRAFVLMSFVVLGLMPLHAQTLVETQFSAPIGSGARALGMGGAFIAIADDATATTWNPGGLGQIEFLEISTVGSYYDFSRTESSQIIGDMNIGTIFRQGDSFAFDFAGVSIPIRPFSKSNFKIVLQYSYQRFINMNLNSNTNAVQVRHKFWQDGHQMLEEGFFYADEKYTGGLDAHSAGIGLKITSWLNVGATANFWTNGFNGGTFKEEAFTITNLDTDHSESFTNLRVEEQNIKFKGTSYNVGTLINLTSNLNLGMVYKSRFTFTVEDEEGEHSSKVEYPESFGLGIAYRPVENLTLAADFTLTKWSKGKITNNDGTYFFPQQELIYRENDGTEIPLNSIQHDSKQFRFGAEYVIITDDFLIPLRAGMFFDRQYFADGVDRIPVYNGLTAGTGIVWKNFVLDVAVIHVSGEYQAHPHSTGVTNYKYTKAIASLIYRL